MGILTGIAAAAILAFVIFGVWKVAWLRRRSRTDGRFIVFAANLRHDTKGRQTTHVLDSLKTQLGVVAGGVPMEMSPNADIPPPDPAEATSPLAPVAIKGRSWLWQQFAHVLIWGDVVADGRTLQLRFATAHGQNEHFRMPLIRELELPASFGAEHGVMLAAATALAIPPAGGESGKRLNEVLVPVVARLRPLAENPPQDFSATARLQLWHLYADAECYLDAVSPDTARLKAAITFLYRGLESWPYEYAPLDWAATEIRLGDALLRIGERETDTGPLLEGVNAYREALRVLTRSRAPAEWAAVQNSLGLALLRIGEREGSPARIEEAVTAFREALRERTYERSVTVWVQTQNNLGNAFCLLGELEGSAVPLNAAIAVFREVLQQISREHIPVNWAMTQHNLGVALARLGVREASAGRLNEAIAAFHQALEERTQQHAPMEWATTQNNLGTAFAALGEVANTTEPIDKAVSAYNYALRVYAYERERVPLEWAGVQNNLGSALALLGERETGTMHLEAAVTAFRAALQEYTRARTPLQWTATQLGLGATFPSLGTDETRPARPHKPVDALKIWARERMPLERAATQNNLGAALLTLGERQARSNKEAATRTLVAAREVVLGALEVRQAAGCIEAIRESQQHLAEIELVMMRLGCG